MVELSFKVYSNVHLDVLLRLGGYLGGYLGADRLGLVRVRGFLGAGDLSPLIAT